MEEIVIYFDHMSQPSRAVLIYCKLAKISARFIELRVLRGDTMTEEFSKISPSQSVPTMIHNGLVLYESHAILAYLADLYPVDNWYPKDLKTRSLIDNYMNWHHLNIRMGCGLYLFNRYGAAILYGRSSDEMEQILTETRDCAFDVLTKNFKNGLYVAGTERPSIADLSCYCEVIGMKWAKLDFNDWEFLKKWMDEMEKIPEVREVHVVFNRLMPRVKL